MPTRVLRFSNPVQYVGVTTHDEDDENYEDRGGDIGLDSAGSHGCRTRKAELLKQQLRVGKWLRKFLANNAVLTEDEAGARIDELTPALRGLLSKSHVHVPESLLDRSRPLPEYYISSSHNTYLMAHQLYGSSSASAYETALKTGSRCVEIDAWDNSADADEPKVTHGFTLVSHIPFRTVCETIRAVYDEEAAMAAFNSTFIRTPILLSLENHCKAHGQRRLAAIMREVFGERLLSEPIRRKGHDEQEEDDVHVSLADLEARICVIVEYRLGGNEAEQPEESDSESSESDSDSGPENAVLETPEAKDAQREYEENKKKALTDGIVPELAELGVYAQSVKPIDDSWFKPGVLTNGPHHHLINVSESGLSSHLPAEATAVAAHNAKHLMRVFPKGTRISSSNLKPLPFWGIGAQICALNWQTYGTSNQLNDALFNGTGGYVLKPAPLRHGGDGNLFSSGRRKTLRLHVAGATDVPPNVGRDPDSLLKPYLTCQLYSPGLIEGDSHKRRTAAYKKHMVGIPCIGDPPAREPLWNETLEWTYQDNELVFLRMLIKSDDAWARNPMIAVCAVRLAYVVPGWSFIQMLDMRGRETKCSILVKFEILNV
ncbi:hypothetical protein E4U19_003015 [Claviceps sp. Clav32 group G5]|nr:hypothetical protein E4U40_002942 [Claviceps sp. LM458 group G5]KAG6025677.1 hypothetical protein E4U19_003015 [Claviceps sp. Clav32 group G5]KAG6042877.1 hypothetical protein E4U39_005310 [Claviceps sp. Clav50 group G5]